MDFMNNDDETARVAVAPAVSNFHKPVDPVASPANMASSRNLMSMAGKEGIANAKSPKSNFLKRLDSPGSNHAKLFKAREELTDIINQCIKLIPQLDVSKYRMIKNKFDTAMEKLDGGKICERRPE